MALILNIDTALDTGYVGLSENGKIIACQNSTNQKEHASFLQPSIQQLMHDAGKKMVSIEAVAVVIGPGSYTGLRVGLASAKGLCYTLKKPLIGINTLELIASAAINEANGKNYDIASLIFCPMIDARRMEVFTATYDYFLTQVEETSAKVLDENSFLDTLENKQIVFSGNGISKFRKICDHKNAIFFDTQYEISQLAKLSQNAYATDSFIDVAYSEPLYVKPFYSVQPIKD